jgi:hypothetical protein
MTILLLLLLIGSCKENGTGPIPPVDNEPKWEVVPEFIGLDIRYMIHFNGELYAAVVNYQADTLYRGAVLKTTDGLSWTLVRTFREPIGPMTVEKDSLYVLSNKFVHKMDKNGSWIIKYGVPWQIADAELNGDMVFLNGQLYVTQTRLTGFMFTVTSDSIWSQIYLFGIESSPIGAKFLKFRNNSVELAYLRPRFGVESYLSIFDGKNVFFLRNGLPLNSYGVNSMAIINDTLFAGFKQLPSQSSSTIMYLDNSNTWKLFLDSIPNSPSAFNYLPPFITNPTELLFINDRIFIATEVYGVLEWIDEKGWQVNNNGLKYLTGKREDEQLYETVTFLRHFKDFLFVGYGNPAYCWGTLTSRNQNGLLKMKL